MRKKFAENLCVWPPRRAVSPAEALRSCCSATEAKTMTCLGHFAVALGPVASAVDTMLDWQVYGQLTLRHHSIHRVNEEGRSARRWTQLDRIEQFLWPRPARTA